MSTIILRAKPQPLRGPGRVKRRSARREILLQAIMLLAAAALLFGAGYNYGVTHTLRVQSQIETMN